MVVIGPPGECGSNRSARGGRGGNRSASGGGKKNDS